MRRTHENVLAEMLEKVLAYNVSPIIRMPEETLRIKGDGTGSGLITPISPVRDR